MSKETLLKTVDLSIGYKKGQRRVKKIAGNLQLEIHSGQLICLLGPNGAGKSTLIRTLAGLQPALSGSIEINKKCMAYLKPVELAKQLSMVLTERVQAGNLTVYSVIALGRFPHTNWLGSLNAEDRSKIAWALKITETEAFANRKLYELSDGENQKVMMARALAQDTPVIILDEPTAHLDLPNRISLMRLLHQLARSTGKAIMLSTHDLDLALQTADQVWLMRMDGQLVKGVPEDMVLDGTFEEAFYKEGFRFDRASGTFNIHNEGTKTIQVTGEGASLFWTKRALSREGYIVTTDTNTKYSINITEDHKKTKWITTDGIHQQKHNSIADVLRFLQSQHKNIAGAAEEKKE